ncbi:MAG: B12-binding domain-containing radical SAM protein [Bacteroidetes bacterium]|nr:B12-binding domain-containing radical SAM protein [Bacteroidota bacterium]
MKKVFLINAGPYKSYSVKSRVYFPTLLLYIGTIIKNKYEVEILDRMVEDFEIATLGDKIKSESSPLACIIHFGTKEINDAAGIADCFKRVHPNAKVIALGLHGAMFPDQVLSDSSFDFVISLDAENVIYALLKSIEDGNVSAMPNVWSKMSNNVLPPSRVENIDMSSLPLLDYELVSMDKYLYRSVGFLTGDNSLKKVIRFSTSRGCLYKCNFCTDPFKGYSRMSNEKIVENLKFIVNKFDPDILYFDDPEFFMNRKESIELLKYINSNFRFQCIGTSRAHYYNEKYISLSVMEELKNCWLVWDVGAETGNSETLKALKKGIQVEQLHNVASYAGQVGVRSGFSFMVGLPNETEEDMINTLILIEELKTKSKNNIIITYQYYQPIGKTELALNVSQYGFIQPILLRDWVNLFDKKTGSIDIHYNKWIERPEFIDYLMLVVKFHINEEYQDSQSSFAKTIRNSWEERKSKNYWDDLWEVELAKQNNLSFFSYQNA